MIGKTISHYKILEKLGEGGMGVVYKAEDTKLQRTVALKFLSPEFTRDAEVKERFIREAQAASSLEHSNICNIHEIQETADGQMFIVMACYQGESLHEKIKQGPLELESAIDIAIQIAGGLAKAHEQGIVHRDMKPANIHITKENAVKILDFGLAKLGENSQLTKKHMMMGTLAYVPPEQLHGEQVDHRADIWSFGVVLYEMLTGQLPFKGDQTPAVMYAIINDDPEPVATQKTGVPLELERIVNKALQKDKKDRYQHIDEMLVDLQRIERDASMDSSRRKLAAFASKKSKTDMGKLAIAGAIFLAAIFAIFAALGLPPFVPEPVTLAMQSVPFTSLPGSEIHPVFSPDGNEIAFAWNGGRGNNYDIYVQAVDSHEKIKLTEHLGADTHPIWTRDGRSIFFQRFDEGEISLYFMSARGANVRKIYTYRCIDDEPNPYVFSSRIRANSRTIHPYRPLPTNSFALTLDGKHIIGRNRVLPHAPFRLVSLNIETGYVDTLTTPPENIYGDFLLALSPDAKTLAFTRCSIGERGAIFIKSLPDGEEKRLTFDEYNISGLVWTADGREIIFSHSGSNLSYVSSDGLWRISVTGGAPRSITSSGPRDLAVSLQKNLLAYSDGVTHSSLYKLNLGKLNQVLGRTKIELSNRSDTSGDISSTGEKIVFRSDRTWNEEIWVSNLDGGDYHAVTDGSDSLRGKGSPRWSPNDRLIAFDAILDNQMKRDIFTVDPESGVLKQITTNTEYDAVPQWSKNGEWIYFRSDRSGDEQIWKIPYQGGEAIQVTQKGGFFSMESPDGAWLYYSKRNEDGLWKIKVTGGEEIRILDDDIHKKNWIVADNGIYFTRVREAEFVFEFFNFTSAEITEVVKIEGEPDLHIDISPDRSILLFSKYDRIESDIMLVENFR